jgi:hypothetical protein
MRSAQSWGFILLSVWLILQGLLTLLNMRFQGSGILLGVIALAAGILILLSAVRR